VLSEGVVEYEAHGDRLGITLLRAVGVIARPTLTTRPIWAGPSIAAPEGQCRGESSCELGVLRDTAPEDLAREWERFALPIVEREASGHGHLSPAQLLRVEGAELSSVRRRGDQLEVRVWNARTTDARARVGDIELVLGSAMIQTVYGAGGPE
jgi:hypothetical protein